MMSYAMTSVEAGVTLNGHLLNSLRFADDIDIVAGSPHQLQELTDGVHDSSRRFGLGIKCAKAKTMAIGKQHKELMIRLNGEKLEQTSEIVYVGGLVTEDGQCTRDIKRRIGLA